MSKHKQRIHGKKQQKSQSLWLIVIGLVIVLPAGAWLVFSNRLSESGEARPISRLKTNDFHSLAISPTEPETVFFGYHNGLLVSYNGGKDWQSTTLTNVDAMALAIPFTNSQTIYAAGHNAIVRSTDGGKTWQSITTNLPGLDIHALAANPENADQIYVFVVDFGIFGSQDGGTNWSQLAPPLALPPVVLDMAVGETTQSLYLAGAEQGIWESLDGGRNWSRIKEMPGQGALTVTYVPVSR